MPAAIFMKNLRNLWMALRHESCWVIEDLHRPNGQLSLENVVRNELVQLPRIQRH
jgi:hypothetical protein